MNMLLTRHKVDPTAALIDLGDELVIVEPIELMRELAIEGRPRDARWLNSYVQHARRLCDFDFEDFDIHPVRVCWPLNADRVHAHIAKP